MSFRTTEHHYEDGTASKGSMKTVRGFVTAVAALMMCLMPTGCVAAGVTSGGHFFIFPSLGLLVVIFIVFLLMRRG